MNVSEKQASKEMTCKSNAFLWSSLFPRNRLSFPVAVGCVRWTGHLKSGYIVMFHSGYSIILDLEDLYFKYSFSEPYISIVTKLHHLATVVWKYSH